MPTSTFTFTRTHTAIFVADHMRNLLSRIIQRAGLDPVALADDWQVLGNAVRIWLEDGDLEMVTIEFFLPGSDRAERRWDFEVSYAGSGADDEMWVDTDHLRRTIEKAGIPPAGCIYRVILKTRPGRRREAPGMTNSSYKSTEGLVGRSTGTAIATQDIMTGLRYWRTA
jgi:hypothetical protein